LELEDGTQSLAWRIFAWGLNWMVGGGFMQNYIMGLNN
jgi:hypothetical protein